MKHEAGGQTVPRPLAHSLTEEEENLPESFATLSAQMPTQEDNRENQNIMMLEFHLPMEVATAHIGRLR
jgi:hypothetical protein